ncbi:hypothetical protein [Crossiella sp. NPDC003009]
MSSTEDRPPRPIARGDVVAAYSEHLGEWTAAQITRLERATRTVAVLELDWSGPEPFSVADLGPELTPATMTPSPPLGARQLVHSRLPWVLPRSHKVIGSAAVLPAGPVVNESPMWTLGLDLGRRRHGAHWPYQDSWVNCLAEDLAPMLDGEPDPVVRELTVGEIEELDCARLVTRFPLLTSLILVGDLGRLVHPASLNRLRSLRRLTITDLSGPTAADRVLPGQLPALEWLSLDRVPIDYAEAVAADWQGEVRHGVDLRIGRAMSPEWFAANRDNPLRDWEGRAELDQYTYQRCLAQYRSTREALLAALAGPAGTDRLTELGQAYGAAFHRLDNGTGFIGYEETGVLWESLNRVVEEVAAGEDLSEVKRALWDGLRSGLRGEPSES